MGSNLTPKRSWAEPLEGRTVGRVSQLTSSGKLPRSVKIPARAGLVAATRTLCSSTCTMFSRRASLLHLSFLNLSALNTFRSQHELFVVVHCVQLKQLFPSTSSRPCFLPLQVCPVVLLGWACARRRGWLIPGGHCTRAERGRVPRPSLTGLPYGPRYQ